MYLFFGTKATGIPKYWNNPLTDIFNWPRMVRIAWILYDSNANEISRKDYTIKPQGFTIPIEASNIHGITTQKAISNGVDLKIVLIELQKLINQSVYLIAHDINFDEKIIGAEFLRNNISNLIPLKGRISTMDSITRFHTQRGNYLYKSPKLSELYKELFATSFEETHNACIDLNVTAKCFWELKKRGIIKIEIKTTELINKNLNKPIPPLQDVLKFRFRSWNFPSWYKSESPTSIEQHIEIPLSNFKSIKLKSVKRLPYIEYFLTIDEEKMDLFKKEIYQNILYKFDNVSPINLDDSNKIYTSNFKKHFPDLFSPIFEITENKASVHKLKDYSKYFTQLLAYSELFEPDINNPPPHIESYKKDYIGFTGKPPSELAKGKEIKCSIILKDNSTEHTDYIFIKNIYSIAMKQPRGQIYEYYILPSDAEEQILNECKTLYDKYNKFISISLWGKFFNEDIKSISNDSNFEKNILNYSKIEINTENQVLIKWIQKRKNESGIYSNANLENYFSNYDDKKMDSFGNNFDDRNHLDDLRSDFYTGLL